LTVSEALATLRGAGCFVYLDGGRVAVDKPAPPPPEVEAAVDALRPHREQVRAALADVSAFVAMYCCRGLRVWCEVDRAHEAYQAHGGRLDRAVFLSAATADGRAHLTPGGLLTNVGLREDWGPEDGGTRERRRGGEHRR
jgi:hypothetical protein